MLKLASLFLVFALAACGEEQETFYDNYADAQKAGAIKRGWIPDFVPASAHNIRERHDIDTNNQLLRFTVNPSDIPGMLVGLRPALTADLQKVTKLHQEVDINASVIANTVCSKPVNGVLLVNRNNGEVVYVTSSALAGDNC